MPCTGANRQGTVVCHMQTLVHKITHCHDSALSSVSVPSHDAGPATWNSLPENIRANRDCEVFRKETAQNLFLLP